MLEIIDTLAMSTPPGPDSPASTVMLDRVRIDCQIWDLTEDICASVLANFTVMIASKPDSNSASNVCGMRGYFLLWPLSIIAQNLRQNMGMGMGVSAVQRLLWIRNVMSYLQNDLGLAKAGAVVKGIPSDLDCFNFLGNLGNSS